MRYVKAQADIIYLFALLFVMVIALFVVDQIWSGLTTNPATQHLFNSTTQGTKAEANVGTSLNILNNAVVLLFLIGVFASVIAAAFTDSSPIFLMPALVILPIEVFFAFIFHDAFFSIVQNSFFAGPAAAYPAIVTLFQYLPIAALVLAVIEVIVIFLK
jgi:hypothetical protein